MRSSATTCQKTGVASHRSGLQLQYCDGGGVDVGVRSARRRRVRVGVDFDDLAAEHPKQIQHMRRLLDDLTA